MRAGSGTENRRELHRPMIWMALAAGLLVVFGFVLASVVGGDAANIDAGILQALRVPGDPDLPRGPDWLRAMFSEITHLGGTVALTLITVYAVGLLVSERKYRAALLVTISVSGGTLISSLLKLGIDRPRPALVPHLVEVTSPSFPSGHAMLSAVVYLTLGALLARFEFVRHASRIYVIVAAVLLTLLIGFSRVYLGVHWPSDVMAGWCLGATWAIVCLLVARRLERRHLLDQSVLLD